MALLRLDHVGVVVEDLPAAVAFFIELGMTLEGEASVEGDWVDAVVGLENLHVEIAMLRTPDGNGAIELTKFHSPEAINAEPAVAPPQTLGIRRMMFAVDDVDDTVARLEQLGGALVGEIAQYEDAYRLCYLRGPEGIIVALAEPHS